MITIKSNKWYGRFWPPERRRVRILNALMEIYGTEIEEKVTDAQRDNYLYGIEPDWEEGA